jgi:hypothetical protein
VGFPVIWFRVGCVKGGDLGMVANLPLSEGGEMLRDKGIGEVISPSG